MTPKQIEKELNRQAVMLEEACMHGYKAKAVKFHELAEEWFEEYAKPNLRNTTYERLLQLRKRVYAASVTCEWIRSANSSVCECSFQRGC